MQSNLTPFRPLCPWCGGSVDDTIPAEKGGPLCVSGWSCLGKVPFRIMLESVREEERLEEGKQRRKARGNRG